jgi:ATP-dependent RNA helicase RhlE
MATGDGSAFADLGLAPILVRAATDMGFTVPTAVQAAAIPAAIAGSDILASAATGSGKSAAFGFPLIAALMNQPRGTTRGLILAPTRELADQIATHLSALARHTSVRVAAIYGGVSINQQISAVKRGTEIIVATPGRLLDVLTQMDAAFPKLTHLVLDEADRMLDMGFLPAVRRVLTYVPKERQTLFFSATLPAEIVKLTKEMLHNPVRVDLTPTTGPAERITQIVYTVPGDRKNDLLLEVLKDNRIFSAIAFTRTKSRANRLAAFLDKHDIPSDRIHGDRSQAQRTKALSDLKRGKLRVLVATDIAARGIDVVELGHVINFDVPLVPEDYVHRVGRTARASASGEAITFVSHEEEKFFAQIEKALGGRIPRSKTPDLGPPSAVPFAANHPHPTRTPRRRTS